jgi:hypothetical protein
MEISRRLIGGSAVLANGQVADVDIDGLICRLLLFDKYVLVSIRLQEFPILVRHLGFEGLIDLLAANLIEIRCECFQAVQVGQSGLFGDPILPPFFYRFNYIDADSKQQYIHDCLKGLHAAPGLKHKQTLRLKKEIVNAIRPLPQEIRPQMFPAFEQEVFHNPSLVRASIDMVFRQKMGRETPTFSLEVYRESPDTFRVQTDLADRAQISEVQSHKIVETGLMGIAGLSQSILEMKAYSALSGFRDEELPLFRHKLDFLAAAVSSHAKERNFQRVIEVADLPRFSEGTGALNVGKLLKIRDTSEAREFRDWLGGIAQASEEEVRERVTGLRARAGLKVSGETGKTMRFLVTAGIGLIPGAGPASLALSAADQFALDKLLPRSGIAAFVNELYPSIFEPRS